MTTPRFKPGLWVALVTPMRDGAIDFKKLAALVERHVAAGTDGLVPCGTTGESATFSHDEHRAVIDAVLTAAAGRLPIMAGTGSNSTREAIELTRYACNAGAQGALVITPYYNKPTPRGLERHFEAVAEAVPSFPICLYNVPGRTAVDMKPETIAAVAARCPTVCAVKEAAGLVERVTEIRALAPRLDIFSGDDALTLPMLALGACGVISVAGNIAPGLMLELLCAFDRGDIAAARASHERLYPLMKGLFIETNPMPIKAAMALAGIIHDELRLPLVSASDSTRAKLREILTPLGLL